jgi:hypothetical protein
MRVCCCYRRASPPPLLRSPPCLQEKEQLYVELKGILARQPGPEVAEQLSMYQARVGGPHRRARVRVCVFVVMCVLCAHARHRRLAKPSHEHTHPHQPTGELAGQDQAAQGPGVRAQHVPRAGVSVFVFA